MSVVSRGTGEVLDAHIADIRDEYDWFAEYVGNMWEALTSTPEWYERARQTAEVREYIYAVDTQSTSNSVNPHSHQTTRPKLCQISDNLKSQYIETLLPHTDTFEFEADDEDAKTLETKYLIEGYIRSRHRLYKHRVVIQECIDDYVEDGNAFLQTTYESRTVRKTRDGAPVKGYIGPRSFRIDPFRIAFNTAAASFDEAPKIVQSLKTVGDIAKDIENEKLPEDYREILRKAMEFRHYVGRNSHLFEEAWLQNPMHGWNTYHQYWTGQHVEILTFYGSVFDTRTNTMHLNKEIAVIDRKWTLLMEDIDTWDGNPLIRHVGWRKRPNSLMGMSPLANLVGMQYYINHIENAKADALDRMIIQDRVMAGIDDIIQNPDGSTDYLIHDGGSVNNLSPDTTILTADNKIERTEQMMEEYAGVPPEAFGLKTPGEQTKFEVSERLSRGALLFMNKARQFEDLLMLPAVNDELELAAKRLDTNLNVLVSRPEGDVFEEINADVLKRKGSLIPTGAQSSQLKARYAQDLSGFMNTMQIDPQVALHFPAKGIAMAWNNVLTGGRRTGLFKEYGRVTEEVELQQVQQAAQEAIAENSAVSSATTDGLAPSPLAPIEGAAPQGTDQVALQ